MAENKTDHFMWGLLELQVGLDPGDIADVLREDSYDTHQSKLLFRQNHSTPEENLAELPLFWLLVMPK